MQALSTKMESMVDIAIANYHQAQQEIQQANRYLQKAMVSANKAGYRYYYSRHQYALNDRMEEQKLKQYVWRSLIEKTGIITLMDSETQRKMDKDLETQPLELTKANILSVLQDLYNRRDAILADSLINVFRALTRQYKSNDPLKLSDKRVIIYVGQGVYRSTQYTDKLTDLDRIFHFLDGQSMTTKRADTLGYLACYGQQDEIENSYFRIKLFKNGNAHVYFKRPDLIDKCNRLIAYHHKNQLGRA